MKQHVVGEGLDVVEQQWLAAQINEFLERVRGTAVTIPITEDRVPPVHPFPLHPLNFVAWCYPDDTPRAWRVILMMTTVGRQETSVEARKWLLFSVVQSSQLQSLLSSHIFFLNNTCHRSNSVHVNICKISSPVKAVEHCEYEKFA